eukprot:1194574-Prorocentrum_minimum.AAC.11
MCNAVVVANGRYDTFVLCLTLLTSWLTSTANIMASLYCASPPFNSASSAQAGGSFEKFPLSSHCTMASLAAGRSERNAAPMAATAQWARSSKG